MTTGLTPKQKQVLDFIREFTDREGYSPSQQEIAKHFGFSSLGTVQNYLVRLEKIGLLKKTWNGKRSLDLTDIDLDNSHNHNEEEVIIDRSNVHTMSKSKTVQDRSLTGSLGDYVASLPLVGAVAAGSPIESMNNNETLEVPRAMVRAGREYFVLKVRGDSMIEDGILDGDYVIVEKREHARNGDTIVALIDNEATIKRYEEHREFIELHPANAKYRSIIVRPDRRFKIEGVFAGLIRKPA